MELRQLRYFVGIAECGSFSEASRQYHLSQSAISQQIKALEEELKISLFARTSHKVKLTESGLILLPLAKQVLQSVCDCQERMSDINKLLCGELNIGLTHSLEPYVRRSMIRFMKIYPQVRLNIYYKTIPEMMSMLRAGLLDIAFSIKVEDEEGLASIPVLEYKLCAFMRDTHPLANRAELTFHDMQQQSIVLPEQGIGKGNAIEEYLSKEGSDMRIRAIINDPCAILNLLKNTNYISILSEHSVLGIDELRAIPIKELSSPIMTYVYQLKGDRPKRSSKEFLRILKEVIMQSQG